MQSRASLEPEINQSIDEANVIRIIIINHRLCLPSARPLPLPVLLQRPTTAVSSSSDFLTLANLRQRGHRNTHLPVWGAKQAAGNSVGPSEAGLWFGASHAISGRGGGWHVNRRPRCTDFGAPRKLRFKGQPLASGLLSSPNDNNHNLAM